MGRRYGLGVVVAALVAAGCTPSANPAAVRPSGVGTASVTIVRADGTRCSLCTYLATTESQRERGLMGATDLGGYDGMLFTYDRAGVYPYWMKNTVMALTAAWFGPDGALIDAVDMAPCAAGDHCVDYGPDALALDVLEVPQGALGRLGLGPGARLVAVGLPCQRHTG